MNESTRLTTPNSFVGSTLASNRFARPKPPPPAASAAADRKVGELNARRRTSEIMRAQPPGTDVIADNARCMGLRPAYTDHGIVRIQSVDFQSLAMSQADQSESTGVWNAPVQVQRQKRPLQKATG